MVLIAGGRSGNNTLSSAELYDPTTELSLLPFALDRALRHSATLPAKWHLLIAAILRRQRFAYHHRFRIYDPTTGTFPPLGPRHWTL